MLWGFEITVWDTIHHYTPLKEEKDKNTFYIRLYIKKITMPTHTQVCTCTAVENNYRSTVYHDSGKFSLIMLSKEHTFRQTIGYK